MVSLCEPQHRIQTSTSCAVGLRILKWQEVAVVSGKKQFCIPLESCLSSGGLRLLFTIFSGFFLAFSSRSDICPWHRHKKSSLYISQDLRLYKGQWWAQFVIISTDRLLWCEALWCPTESHLVNQALCQSYKCFLSLVCEMEVCVLMFNPLWIHLNSKHLARDVQWTQWRGTKYISLSFEMMSTLLTPGGYRYVV